MGAKLGIDSVLGNSSGCGSRILLISAAVLGLTLVLVGEKAEMEAGPTRNAASGRHWIFMFVLFING